MTKFNDDDLCNYSLIKDDKAKPCVKCGHDTNYIDYLVESRVCSHKCRRMIYKSIEEKQKEMGMLE